MRSLVLLCASSILLSCSTANIGPIHLIASSTKAEGLDMPYNAIPTTDAPVITETDPVVPPILDPDDELKPSPKKDDDPKPPPKKDDDKKVDDDPPHVPKDDDDDEEDDKPDVVVPSAIKAFWDRYIKENHMQYAPSWF